MGSFPLLPLWLCPEQTSVQTTTSDVAVGANVSNPRIMTGGGPPRGPNSVECLGFTRQCRGYAHDTLRWLQRKATLDVLKPTGRAVLLLPGLSCCAQPRDGINWAKKCDKGRGQHQLYSTCLDGTPSVQFGLQQACELLSHATP